MLQAINIETIIFFFLAKLQSIEHSESIIGTGVSKSNIWCATGALVNY